MPKANTDAHAATTIAMVQMSLGAQDPLWRAKYLSDAQMQLGWALRAAVEECQEAGMSWQAIGNALGVPKETMFRQYSAGGPVITAKPVQSMNSPGVTEMHRPAIEAVYAFRTQNGNWFGPHEALPARKFTDGTLRFEPAQPVNAVRRPGAHHAVRTLGPRRERARLPGHPAGWPCSGACGSPTRYWTYVR